jgi:hypothetical protein
VIRALARAVAVHGARERAATWRQDDFWSRSRKLCPNRSDGGSLSSTAPVRVMQQRFYTTKTTTDLGFDHMPAGPERVKRTAQESAFNRRYSDAR